LPWEWSRLRRFDRPAKACQFNLAEPDSLWRGFLFSEPAPFFVTCLLILILILILVPIVSLIGDEEGLGLRLGLGLREGGQGLWRRAIVSLKREGEQRVLLRFFGEILFSSCGRPRVTYIFSALSAWAQTLITEWSVNLYERVPSCRHS
jgi:hypothetical protein